MVVRHGLRIGRDDGGKSILIGELRYEGKSPLTVSLHASDTYRILAESENMVPIEIQHTVANTQEDSVTVIMRWVHVNIRLQASPIRLPVRVDGRWVSASSVTLPLGEHVFYAEVEGYTPKDTTIVLTADGPDDVFLELNRVIRAKNSAALWKITAAFSMQSRMKQPI